MVRNPRLRECNYGDLNRVSKKAIGELKDSRINEPYLNGERWQQVIGRIREFLAELQKRTDRRPLKLLAAELRSMASSISVTG